MRETRSMRGLRFGCHLASCRESFDQRRLSQFVRRAVGAGGLGARLLSTICSQSPTSDNSRLGRGLLFVAILSH